MTGTMTAQGQAFDAAPAPEGRSAVSRLTDWIWHVRDTLPLAPGQSADDAFERLDPLFRARGTERDRTTDTLTFTKKDPAAQDRMAVFGGGVLKVEQNAAGPVLRYRLTSPALLYCFLAPLLFLAFAQATVFLGTLEKPKTAAEIKKAEAAAKKPPKPLNPIDKALGAPAPDPPKKKGKAGEDDKKPSPTPGYVFAGIFAALYAVGRVLEATRIRALFKRTLASG
jgi:hypothetical protein